MALAPEQVGIGIRRHFTEPGVHPYDTLEWERREARIPNWKDGTDAFLQPDVEFPVTWSQNATNIVAQKYFRGTLGTEERETSLRQVIDRVADTITSWGVKDGYFVDEQEGAAFRNELKYILVTQRAAFNSPVWFNIGVKGVPQQAERVLHPRGRRHDGRHPQLVPRRRHDLQGRLRLRHQPVEHPLVVRAPEGRRHRQRPGELHARRRRVGRHDQERRQDPPRRQDGHPQRRPPRRRGVHLVQGHRGAARPARCATPASTWTSTARTPTRSSTRTPTTRCGSPTSSCRRSSTTTTGTCGSVTTGEAIRTVKARDLFRQISQAAWECADPGMQFDTTINRWHTAPNSRPHQRPATRARSTCTSTTRRATSPASTC